MPRTIEQYEEIRENRKAQIMETAMELFAEEGYHIVSISRIANKAGISKGLMYNYFHSKEELIISILNQGMEALFELFDPNHDGVITDEEFENFLRKSYQMIKKNRRFWKLYFALFTQPKLYQFVADKFEKILTESMSLLISYFDRKGIEDPETEAILLGAALDGIAFNYVMNPKLFPLDKVTEQIIRKYIHTNNNKNK